MKTITLLLFTIIVNTCGSSKTVTTLAENNTNSKMIQDDFNIEYKAHTRGSYKKVVLNNKTVSIQNGHSDEPVLKSCSNEQWNALLKIVENINLKNLSTLEAPTKAHQYDGAPMVNFSITKNGDTYDVPVFDVGNPNKAIKPLIDMVLNIAAKTKG